MKSLNRALASGAGYAPIILRVIVGIWFLWHGIAKFNDMGISNVEGAFANWGVPAPGLAAPFTAVAEIVIGIALIVGVATRIAALLGSLIIVGAIIFAKLTPLEGSFFQTTEVDFMYIAGFVAIMLLGPGRFSVDEAVDLDDTVIDLRHKSTDKVMVEA